MGEVIRNWWQAVVAWVSSPAVSWVDLIISGVILAAAIAIAVLFSTLIFRWLLRRSIMAGVDFDVKTVAAVREMSDGTSGFVVRSELIKRLHSRFGAEGITINYPVRTLQFPEGFTTQDLAQLPDGIRDETK